MAAQAGRWSGALPKPTASAGRIEYYVEATDKAFTPVRTAEHAAAVVDGPGACRKDALVAATSPSARVLLVAPQGAPALPAGFLNAGLVTAGAGGLSAAAIVGIVARGVAVAGGAVAATRGGDAPPETTTLPPAPSLAGSWAGTMSRDVVNNIVPPCHREDDFFLELQQSGESVTGNARYVSRAGTTCDLEPLGTVRAFSATGSLAGSRMSGAVVSTFPAGGSRGTWSVQRQ
jgi:hypothetical protein